MNTNLSIQAQGRWTDILCHLGIDHNYLRNRHGECPMCGGVDRFRYDNKDGSGSYFCNSCGAGDGAKLAMQYTGLSFKDTASEIRKILGVCKMEAVKTEAPDIEKRKARLAEILKGCKRITADTVAAKYFAGRRITETPEADCFFHPALEYFNSEGVRRGDHPAIVSRIRTPDGEISSFQVLYLTNDGKKLNTPDCRKILPVIAPMKGGAIRLFEATDILYISEGLESAMSARVDTGMPVWCAVNAGNLEAIVIPETVKHIYIVADMDESGTGLKSASALYHKLLMKKDRETVNIVIFHEHQQIILKPESYDYNDYLILQSAA